MVIKTFNDPVTGAPRDYYGTVTYEPLLKPPFTVTYTDHDTERMGLQALKRILQPEGTTLPAAFITPIPTALPLTLPLDHLNGVLETLNMLMPGTWAPNHASRLCNLMPGHRNFLQRTDQSTPGHPECVATATQEVQPLLQQLDFSHCPTILDPWAGTKGVKQAFAAHHLHIITNDINPQHQADYCLDALQPSTYHTIINKQGPISAIVMSSLFALLDLALPIAERHATDVVCAHVPGHYLTDGPDARFRWLRRFQQQGRLHLILGLPRGPMGRRCLWLIIFASSAVKRRLLRPEFAAGGYTL